MNTPRAAIAVAALLAASCAMPPAGPGRDELGARTRTALAERGFDADILGLVDNVLGHEPGPPPHTPPLVRALLAEPLAAADAEVLFRRAVPPGLGDFDARAAPGGAQTQDATLDELLADYIAEVAQAQHLLREAAGKASIDPAAIVSMLENGLDPAEPLLALEGVDGMRLAEANARFVRATARFVSRLRGAGGALAFPGVARRFDSPIGLVEIGTRAAEHHAAGAALIVDPGGDDRYERSALSGGRVSVIVDLAGSDTYSGSDIVVDGLGAIVDFSGDDHYESGGPGLAAAVLGASLLVDFSGNDVYRSGRFGQAAAGFGLAALIDYGGDDDYEVQSIGQGFGLAGGVGLLWDKAGNDHYRAGGMEDAYRRGGGVSFAQGAAFGLRTMLAGGTGILRDDAGDDAYEAQMFAQGTGYFYGLGLAWDRSGNDTWHAVRYAQGNGVHQAVGVLRDESGNDRYELGYGVGQGMGLDLSVGLLYDADGDDRYGATVYAQGSATANGIGVLFDAGGADEWRMSANPRAWGRAEPARRLPSLALLLYRPGNASFVRDGKAVPAPHGGTPIEVPEHAPERCPPAPAAAAAKPGGSLADALLSLEFLFRGGSAEPGAQAYVRERLRDDLPAALDELPGDDFTVDWILGNLLPCVLVQAAPEQAATMWNAMERVLATHAASPFALSIALALRRRPPPAPQLQRMLSSLRGHPSCAVQAGALVLDSTAAAAQSALRSSCWLLQATALQTLDQLGVAPESARLPSFLRRR